MILAGFDPAVFGCLSEPGGLRTVWKALESELLLGSAVWRTGAVRRRARRGEPAWVSASGHRDGALIGQVAIVERWERAGCRWHSQTYFKPSLVDQCSSGPRCCSPKARSLASRGKWTFYALSLGSGNKRQIGVKRAGQCGLGPSQGKCQLEDPLSMSCD